MFKNLKYVLESKRSQTDKVYKHIVKKLDYISEEDTITESIPKESMDLDNSQISENAKWLQYGVTNVKIGNVYDINNDRLYIVDSHPDSGRKFDHK